MLSSWISLQQASGGTPRAKSLLTGSRLDQKCRRYSRLRNDELLHWKVSPNYLGVRLTVWRLLQVYIIDEQLLGPSLPELLERSMLTPTSWGIVTQATILEICRHHTTGGKLAPALAP
jgi:hypothetical protein